MLLLRRGGQPRRLCSSVNIAHPRFKSTSPDNGDDIVVEKLKDDIVTIALNRHDGKNSFSKGFLAQFRSTISVLRDDKSVKVMIVKSNVPSVFCAGADLKERLKMPEEEVADFVDQLRDTMMEVERLPFPTIAAIEGAALGGGLELAMACDMRIAGNKSTLGLPETSLAIIPGAGGTQRLPRLVGQSKAKELIFCSTKVTSGVAEQIGLVNESVDFGKAFDRAYEIARVIASKGPIAVRAAKRAVDEGMNYSAMAMDIEKECYASVIKTNDRREGLKAFTEKRLPVYTNS